MLHLVNQTVSTNDPETFITDEYQCLFEGIAKVKGKVIKLHIDTEVQPKQQSHRRVPFHIRKDIEKELKRLEELDIIEEVSGPTPG